MAAKKTTKTTATRPALKQRAVAAFNQANAAVRSPQMRSNARTVGLVATGTLVAIGVLEGAKALKAALA